MAVASFVFCGVDRDVPAINWSGARSEEVVIGGSSVATTAAATAGQVFCRVAVDTESYVAFGAAPDAAVTPRALLPAGTVEYFRVRSGDKAAVKASAD